MPMNARDLYERGAGAMEDYWGRRLHEPRFERRIEVFGRLVEEVEEAVMRNSLFFDTFRVWKGNLEVLQRLVQRARWHHLYIGADVESIVETVDSLWEEA